MIRAPTATAANNLNPVDPKKLFAQQLGRYLPARPCRALKQKIEHEKVEITIFGSCIAWYVLQTSESMSQ
jgi:hypothetical protein